jgi:hypothetical protein
MTAQISRIDAVSLVTESIKNSAVYAAVFTIIMDSNDDALRGRAAVNLAINIQSVDGFQGFYPRLAGHRLSSIHDVRVTSYIWHIFTLLTSLSDGIGPQTAEKAMFPQPEKGYTPAPYCAYLSSVYKG